MVQVTVDGERREYEIGTLLKDVAEEFQPKYENDILLAFVNGKLQELHKLARSGTEIRFLTAKDKPGMQTYHRSVTLLLLKSFYDVVGAKKIQKISVDFSIGGGLFLEAAGDFVLDQALLEKVKARMQECVKANMPIMKRNISTDEAVELFRSYRMHDKEHLFEFRRVSRVNVYNIDGFEDYYYGYMVQHTGYLKYFDLVPYQQGMVLLLPGVSDPKKIPVFAPQEKLFRVLKESEDWGRKLKVSNVAALNKRITKGGMNDLVLIQEALMEKKMGDIADRIAMEPDKKFVMIAGPSSSGKTTFSHRLSIQLRAKGLTPHPIAVDNYFVNRADSPRDEQGNYNYESLKCIDVEQFNRDMQDLLAGKTVELPEYNFISGEREYRGNKLALGAEDILVIEGIHCLNEALSYSLPKENKFKIYISALTQLSVDEHNRIPTTDGRLIRRMIRDSRTRGASAQDTIRRWPSVRRGEEENIFPYQEEADVMFNSALVYEFAVLKQYAEPLLFSVPRNSAEYLEAKRLLKFLDYFLGVSSEDIPRNSILREFIGGSCFKV
ncbi:nucleoside kinase [Clostridiaceae bacterium]|nr:nucleoside kinase [Clostridiaceae bacterium]RKI15553.1 nucleoside kinase [bacterium 1XD21-70]